MTVNVIGKKRPVTFNASERIESPLNSATTQWAGLPVEIRALGPEYFDLTTDPVVGEHAILIIMNGRLNIVLREDERYTNLIFTPGTGCQLSGNRPLNFIKITGFAEAAVVRITPEWFRRVSLDNASSTCAMTIPLFWSRTLVSIVRAMCDEINNGSKMGRLFAESLSMAFLSYLMARTLSLDVRSSRGLSDAQCLLLRKYIEENLCEDLSLSVLANVVKYRRRHFSTRFRQAFGVTPHQYVMRVRLAEARRLLAKENEDIAEIARCSGFCSQSHFTTVFGRFFGTTPGRYAAETRKRFSPKK